MPRVMGWSASRMVTVNGCRAPWPAPGPDPLGARLRLRWCRRPLRRRGHVPDEAPAALQGPLHYRRGGPPVVVVLAVDEQHPDLLAGLLLRTGGGAGPPREQEGQGQSGP